MNEEKYIPSKESLAFISFIRACNIEDNKSPEIHYKLADKYFGRDKQVVIESFRGSAKSSLMEWLVIYIATLGELPGFGDTNFIAFVGDSADNGVKNFFRNIGTKVEKSDLLRKYLTIDRITNEEAEITNSSGKTLFLKGYGMKTNIRGVRYKGYRPDIVILDDVTTNEAMTSDVIQQTINDNFYKAIIPALHPTKFRIYFIGTPISENDILHQLRNNKKWIVHKFPICEKFPCKKNEFDGNWEDRFPYDAVKDKYDTYKNSGQLQSFFQEYMLELTDLSTLIVDLDEDVRYFDTTEVLAKKGNYNFYITTDFATSTKQSADYSVISIWAVGNNQDWFLVDGQCIRQEMSVNMDDLFNYVQKYKPLSVAIEVTGQQGGFISWIQSEMIKRNIFFNLASERGKTAIGIRPSKDKLTRFVTAVSPRFKQNKIWIPKEDLLLALPKLKELVQELKNELGKLTLSGGVKQLKHDDVIDTITQMGEIEIFYPSKESSYEYNSRDKMWHVQKEEEIEGSSYIF